MSDPRMFEARLVDALQRYADAAPTDVDAHAVASAIVRRRDGPVRGDPSATLGRAMSDPARLARLLLVAALLAALIGALLLVGSQRRLPPPFGPAANGLIAFDRGGDVYAGDPATGSHQLVLGGPAQESAPAFSPDGTRIALIQSTSQLGLDRVVVVGVDGRDPVVVTPDPLLSLTSVSWTPDGRSLALVALVGTRHAYILADANGSGVRTIVDDLDVDGSGPSFRPPDGHEVMFTATTPEGVGIYVMDADGSHRRALIPPTATGNPEYDLREPRYSPDGSQIAYMSWDDQLGQMRTWIMNADGTGKRQLTHDPRTWFEGWPVWSPDGRRVILIREFYGPDRRPLDNTRPFAVAWVDGHAPTIETGPPMTTGQAHADWSPDGTKLLAQGNTVQLLIDPAGGPWQPLPWDSNAYPAWQRLAP